MRTGAPSTATNAGDAIFSRHASKLTKLVAAGFPEPWIRTLKELLANPIQSLDHQGPVSITLGQGRLSRTAANQGEGPVPEDAQTGPPALTLANFGGRALHSQGGHWVLDRPAGDTTSTLTINIPTTFNNYAVANFPVTFNDDVRHNADVNGVGLIDKYGLPSYGSTVRRCKLLEDLGASIAGKVWCIGLDGTGAAVGIPFLARDRAGAGGSFSCAKKGGCAYAVYFSDLAGTITLLGENNVKSVLSGASADVAVRPNIGGWELISVDASTVPPTSITIVSKICCVAGTLVVCTRTLTFQICPGSVTQGAQDCGGSADCT